MSLRERISSLLGGRKEPRPEHIERGEYGEREARKRLSEKGLKFLTANYASERGEIDLIFRDRDCLVFVEVKTRSDESWTRPAAAVNATKKKKLTLTALDYLKQLNNPEIKIRFDIVEVLLDEQGEAREIRHLENSFPMTRPFRYG